MLSLLGPLIGRFGWRAIAVVVALYFVVSYTGLCNGGGSSTGALSGLSTPPPGASDDELEHFAGYVLDDVQTTWSKMVPGYRTAHMVVYSGAINSGCGTAESAVGPFYCPEDQKVYLDLGFYQELRDRFGAPGDFAQAYVIAHELGHHVQDLRGVMSSRGSVQIELQADCLAGVWAKDAEARGELEAGDVQEAIGAAAAVGDDRLEEEAGQRVRPETWTHGSSAQRTASFEKGYQGGTLEACGL